jgi:magnesium chelatase accessory protein
VLVAGSADPMVPPWQARKIQRLVPGAEMIPLTGLGHLAHEEAPERVAEVVLEVARARGVLAPA